MMLRTMCKSKIHRATLTDANLHYEGSITIDSDLLEAADILPYEKVQVVIGKENPAQAFHRTDETEPCPDAPHSGKHALTAHPVTVLAYEAPTVELLFCKLVHFELG